jgi:hypothetical protein
MRDWNLRVILHRIWEDRDRSWRSWAVQRGVQELDRRMWERHGVDLRDVHLSEYTKKLSDALDVKLASKVKPQSKEPSGAVG